jgi:hypothetical protein
MIVFNVLMIVMILVFEFLVTPASVRTASFLEDVFGWTTATFLPRFSAAQLAEMEN